LLDDILAGKPRIELLATDIDGVLTDGAMYFGLEGQALKAFNVKDGQGIAYLRNSGVKIVFITADSSEIGRVRGEKLRVTEVCLHVPDKALALQEIMDKHGIAREAVVYVGDDLPDLCLAGLAGTFCAPSDAVDEILAAADHVTQRGGGQGAMREICDAILRHNERVGGGEGS
jgi:3-deoxy-D-manno-octulosonate 8-phosphate phosphatase (KDO 8-P phosphatase)